MDVELSEENINKEEDKEEEEMMIRIDIRGELENSLFLMFDE